MSTPLASRGKRGRGNDTVDDGGTDSFWQDFAVRVDVQGRRLMGAQSGRGQGKGL